MSQGSERLLQWLCWALVVCLVITAVVFVGIGANILVQRPDVSNLPDLVERLQVYRASDRRAYPIYQLGTLALLGVFVISPLLGVVMRRYVPGRMAGDLLATTLIIGGVVGVVAQLINLGVNQVATYEACDCPDRDTQLIAQQAVLNLGYTVERGVSIGAISIVGLGIALAGRLIDVSSGWRILSYVIAVALIASNLALIAGYGDAAFVMSGVVAEILVTIWAIMLGRAAPGLALNRQAA